VIGEVSQVALRGMTAALRTEEPGDAEPMFEALDQEH
jgi:hypothetical protein